MKSHETPIKPYEFSGVHFHLKEESVSDYHNPVPDTNPRVTHHHRIPPMTGTRKNCNSTVFVPLQFTVYQFTEYHPVESLH